jgi:hypothetical protein
MRSFEPGAKGTWHVTVCEETKFERGHITHMLMKKNKLQEMSNTFCLQFST